MPLITRHIVRFWCFTIFIGEADSSLQYYVQTVFVVVSGVSRDFFCVSVGVFVIVHRWKYANYVCLR